MYNMPRFISVFHMKFVRTVQNLDFECLTAEVDLRELVKKFENKAFSILFVLIVY